jgi:hypothetical protein
MKKVEARRDVRNIVLMTAITALLTFALSLDVLDQKNVEAAPSWPFSSAVPKGFELQRKLKLNDSDVWVLQGKVHYFDGDKSRGVTETILIMRETKLSPTNDLSQAALVALYAAEAAAGLDLGSSRIDIKSGPMEIIEGTHAGFTMLNIPPRGVKFVKDGNERWKEVFALGGVAAKEKSLRIAIAGASIAGDSSPDDADSRRRVDRATIEMRDSLRREFNPKK